MMISNYDRWATQTPEEYFGRDDLPVECVICHKTLAYNNICGVCYRKECRKAYKQQCAEEAAYEEEYYKQLVEEGEISG